MIAKLVTDDRPKPHMASLLTAINVRRQVAKRYMDNADQTTGEAHEVNLDHAEILLGEVETLVATYKQLGGK